MHFHLLKSGGGKKFLFYFFLLCFIKRNCCCHIGDTDTLLFLDLQNDVIKNGINFLVSVLCHNDTEKACQFIGKLSLEYTVEHRKLILLQDLRMIH